MDNTPSTNQEMDSCKSQQGLIDNEPQEELIENESPLLASFEGHFLTASDEELRLHETSNERQSVCKVYKCKICNYQTKRQSYFEQHMQHHLQDSLSVVTEIKEPDGVIGDTEIKETDGLKKEVRQGYPEVKCDDCGFIAKKKSHLKIHIAKHIRARKIENKEALKCPTCSYECAKVDTMERHILKHKELQDIEMFSCDMCQYKTKWKCALKRHVDGHVNDFIFKCTMCSYESKHKDSLKGHMLVHKDLSEVKLFNCSECDFQTKRKKTLKVHLENHFSDQLYSCTMCSYKTKYKYIFNKHMLIHSDKTGEEVFKCTKCKFQTKRKGNLENHLLKHKIQEQDNSYDVLIE